MQNKLYGSPELQQQQLRVLERGSEREKLNLKTFHTPHTTRCVFFVSFRIVSRCAFVDFQCFVAIFRLYLNYCVCCVCLSRHRYSCRYIDTETHRYTIYLCFAWLSFLTFPNAQRGADALKVARTNLTDTRYGTDWLHTRRTTDNAGQGVVRLQQQQQQQRQYTRHRWLGHSRRIETRQHFASSVIRFFIKRRISYIYIYL